MKVKIANQGIEPAFYSTLSPLRKVKKDGTLYVRTPPIEAKICELVSLGRDNLVDRGRITSRDDPDYVPSECLLYFLRFSRGDENDGFFTDLYRILAARILRAMPTGESSDGKRISLPLKDVRDQVLDKFVEMLVADRNGYLEKLDFFEVRFDMAISRLRDTAKKQVRRRDRRHVPIDRDESNGELTAEVEKAAGSFDPFNDEKNWSFEYRSRLDAAIDLLPPLQRGILEMLRKGIPIESKDPGAVTISKTFQKVEKTIRNQRDKAFTTLQEMLPTLAQS